MNILNDARQRVQLLLQENATTLLTAGGVVGTVTTALLSGRAGYKAAELIIAEEQKRWDAVLPATSEEKSIEFEKLTKMEKTQLVGLQFAPPILSGVATISSIILAHRMSASKAAALAAAYGLAEKQLGEYKDMVEEKLTGPKKQAIDDELAQDRVNNTPGSSQIVIIDGEVLCFDSATGRYFRGSMDKINKAVNRTNEEILHHNYTSASFFYEELGLPSTTWSDEVGWNTNNLVQLTYSTVLSHDQKPCIAIDFAYLPRVDYITGY